MTRQQSIEGKGAQLILLPEVVRAHELYYEAYGEYLSISKRWPFPWVVEGYAKFSIRHIRCKAIQETRHVWDTRSLDMSIYDREVILNIIAQLGSRWRDQKREYDIIMRSFGTVFMDDPGMQALFFLHMHIMGQAYTGLFPDIQQVMLCKVVREAETLRAQELSDARSVDDQNRPSQQRYRLAARIARLLAECRGTRDKLYQPLLDQAYEYANIAQYQQEIRIIELLRR